MKPLDQFYLALSTDAEKTALFNSGSTTDETANIRSAMLKEAGVTSYDKIAYLTQEELRELMAKSLEETSQEWKGLQSSSGNTNNTDNRISLLGNKKIH